MPEKRTRRRDPERTREAILEVAGKVLAKDGPEGLSVSEVAQRAGINRGTAYHHFQTREELLKATTAWVSEKLCHEVFGDIGENQVGQHRHDPRTVTENLTNFALENPEFGRVWLFEVLSSNRPADDPFWNLYKAHTDAFVDSELSKPGIDSEVHAMVALAGVFLWPVWTRAHAKTPEERRELGKRYTREALRQALHGTLQRDKFPEFNREKPQDREATDQQPID